VVVRCVRLCEELFLSLMSFVSGRRFPSRLRNQGAYEIKGESKKKNNSAAKKEKSKVLFLQREK
jgi:hypothetical protein